MTGRLEDLCGGAYLLRRRRFDSPGGRRAGRAFSNLPQRRPDAPVYDLGGRSLSIRDRATGR